MTELLKPDTEQIGADLSEVVDKIRRQYSDPFNAFQKEAIQNSWDAREDRREGSGWLVNIDTFQDKEENEHVIVEDSGTNGMNEEGWEAFQSLWKPSKKHEDAGGQGQGKFVLMSASATNAIIVESSSKDVPYGCKFLQNDQKSKSNYKIQDFIPEAQQLKHIGTRVWIYNARKDFLEAMKSPQFVEAIQESWWQLLLGDRFGAEMQLMGKKLNHPALPSPNEEKIILEAYPLRGLGRIKRLTLRFYENPIPEIFQGIRVQRANMMVTKIPFDVPDEKYLSKFSGYIEFDRDLEENLKEVETTDHCGFVWHASPWKEIKEIVQKEAQKFVSEIAPALREKPEIKVENLSQIIKKANQIINDYYPDLAGTGTPIIQIPRKQKEPFRIGYVTVNKREAKYGDTIKPRCSIVNETDKDRRFELFVEIRAQNLKTPIREEKFRTNITNKTHKIIRIADIDLNKDFPRGKYTLRVTLKELDKDLDTKATSFYLETKREVVKDGFIKDIRPWQNEDDPVRSKLVSGGIIEINLGHKDFSNIYENFKDSPRILNKQMGFYILKICLDEAVGEILKANLNDPGKTDFDNVTREIHDTKDRMYHDIYT